MVLVQSSVIIHYVRTISFIFVFFFIGKWILHFVLFRRSSTIKQIRKRYSEFVEAIFYFIKKDNGMEKEKNVIVFVRSMEINYVVQYRIFVLVADGK